MNTASDCYRCKVGIWLTQTDYRILASLDLQKFFSELLETPLCERSISRTVFDSVARGCRKCFHRYQLLRGVLESSIPWYLQAPSPTG